MRVLLDATLTRHGMFSAAPFAIRTGEFQLLRSAKDTQFLRTITKNSNKTELATAKAAPVFDVSKENEGRN